ncbi:MAG: yxeP 1 [Gammaproteobacteria bacterium]|jgi:hippurate hydrolase|nr:yxeP 1 [Gammaproteobacteria bacterium]
MNKKLSENKIDPAKLHLRGNKLRQLINEMTPHFTEIRQKIHMHPELGYQEKLTAAVVAHELKQMGLNVVTGVGGTGVVAIIDSRKPGKTVALRAELDALPMTEMAELTYKSIHPDKMHACGHDGHTATLLMAAYALCNFKNSFKGRVKLIFQPAEEGSGAGAAAMIQEGVLDSPKVDAIFAYHNYPGFPMGAVQTRGGTVLSGNTNFTITVYGKGGHAASPDLNINPILIGAGLIQEIHELKLGNGQIISITEIHGGSSKNIVPGYIILGGTLRYITLLDRQSLKEQLTITMNEAVLAYGGEAKIEFIDHYSPTINAAAETQHVFRIAHHLLGNEKVVTKQKPARAAEDFSFYLEKVPGCYFFMGNGENSASCHNSEYDFNDALLPHAAELLCRIAIDYLNHEGPNLQKG